MKTIDWTPDQLVTAADLTEGHNEHVALLADPPRFSIFEHTNAGITNNSALLQWKSENFRQRGGWKIDSTPNNVPNARFIVPTTGLYLISLHTTFVSIEGEVPRHPVMYQKISTHESLGSAPVNISQASTNDRGAWNQGLTQNKVFLLKEGWYLVADMFAPWAAKGWTAPSIRGEMQGHFSAVLVGLPPESA